MVKPIIQSATQTLYDEVFESQEIAHRVLFSGRVRKKPSICNTGNTTSLVDVEIVVKV